MIVTPTIFGKDESGSYFWMCLQLDFSSGGGSTDSFFPSLYFGTIATRQLDSYGGRLADRHTELPQATLAQTSKLKDQHWQSIASSLCDSDQYEIDL